MKIKLAIVGIEGLPNKYGGFETLASYLVKYLGNEFETTVYCSSLDISSNDDFYETAVLKYISFSSHGWQGVVYDILSLKDALKKNDLVLFLGFGAGIFFPFLTKKERAKIILNFGGLDWLRSKWGPITRLVIRYFEFLMVSKVLWVIADNRKITEYIQSTYSKIPIEIAYGGDQVKQLPLSDEMKNKFPFLREKYACAVCRIQPDNNIELMLDAFSRIQYPLVIIGNWDSSGFGIDCKKKYARFSNIHLLDAIYDTDRLNIIRSNCTIYIHGHSVGGTNPSLVEAMFLGLNIFAYKSGYNEITTDHLAKYFDSVDSLIELIQSFSEFDQTMNGRAMYDYALQNYTWKQIAGNYKDLFLKVYHKSNEA
jgi:glycosyltransferase involved in cell wall biosynthesis